MKYVVCAFLFACGTADLNDASFGKHKPTGTSSGGSGSGSTGSSAGSSTGSSSGGTIDTTTPGVIACPNAINPTAECQPGLDCYFSNYSAPIIGDCETNAYQTFGLATCDGPEDCNGGYCCIVFPDNGENNPTVNVACQATPCATTRSGAELCHSGSAAAGTCHDTALSCVAASAAAIYQVPASWQVCH